MIGSAVACLHFDVGLKGERYGVAGSDQVSLHAVWFRDATVVIMDETALLCWHLYNSSTRIVRDDIKCSGMPGF